MKGITSGHGWPVVTAGPARGAADVAGLYLLPDSYAFVVSPGDVVVQAGGPLRIAARIEGLVGVEPVLRVREGAEWRDAPMAAGPEEFAVGFERVDESFRYAVIAGRASSREYTVTVIRQPRVERIDLRYEYPPAAGIPPREERDGGDIYGPAGTRVMLTVFVDKPIAQARLNLAGGTAGRTAGARGGARGRTENRER